MSTNNITDTVRALVSDATLLVKQEVSLAKAEAEEKFEQVQTGLIAIVSGLLTDIGNDLSPSRLLGNAVGLDAETSSRALSAMVAKSRENPLSALMVGIGVAGFLFGQKRDPSAAQAEVTMPTTEPVSADPSQRFADNTEVLKEQVSVVRVFGIDCCLA